jgi:predicted permease
MGDLLQDLRYSLRMLAKSPLFTLVVVVTLSLGIGLNAATFSAVHGILLRPLGGVQDPQELVQIYRSWPGMDWGSVSVPHYLDLRERSGEAFQDVASHMFLPMSLSVEGRSERTMGMLVSANFFQTLGVTPSMGRAFLPEVESVGPGAHPVAVLGHDFWHSRFGGDPGILGRTILLNGHSLEVVGVAPPEFKGPVNFAAIPIYVPLVMQREMMPGVDFLEARGNNWMNVMARLRDGVTVEQAGQVLDAVLLQLREEHPADYEHQTGHALVMQNEAGIHPMFRSAQLGMSSVMMVVVGLLLLIACVNVANLFLARARDRRREMGVRLSMGASRGRIVRQLLTESLVFSLLGGLGGLVLARIALALLAGVTLPMDGPWDLPLAMDNTVLGFTLAVSLFAGLLFGMAPALQAASPDTMGAVKGDSDAGGKGSRASSTLVVLQMALSVLLLISSGLFLRSLQGATRIHPGFTDPASLAVASVDPGLQGYDAVRSREFLDRLVEEVGAVPGVTVVGMTSDLPLGLSSSSQGVAIPGYEFAEGEQRGSAYHVVTEGYLEALGVRLMEGRTFTPQDDGAGPPVLVVNQRFADRFWPGESAVGKTVRTGGQDHTVIGVVETGKYRSLGEPPTEFMFLSQRQRFISGMTLAARTSGDPRALLGEIHRLVRSMDPDLPVFDARTMEEHMGIALFPARLGGTVLGVFGLLGLSLAAVGIYGVMAYSVARRGRELGIRVALGADKGRILKLVMGEGMRLALLGMVLGMGAAFGASRLVRGLLYGVSAVDPAAFAGVPLLLGAVAALAVYLPARRAASVAPMTALKVE